MLGWRSGIVLTILIYVHLRLTADNNLYAGESKQPPNIVMILADDFGVGDIHALFPSNKLLTPNLDRLVAQGMHFTDAHTGSAVCTPTRYGILTGRYAWRTRLQDWVLACYEPPLIDADRQTLPSYLKEHGYHTACIGKWHLGWNWPGPQPSRMDETPNALHAAAWDFTRAIQNGPTTRGFDEYFGVDLPNYPPFTFIENDRVTVQPTAEYKVDPKRPTIVAPIFAGSPMAPGWKFDEILPTITERAVEHIHRRARSGEPFFLYFAMTSPHEPVAPSKEFLGKSGVAPIADFLMETDWSAGEVIKAIDAAGIGENTIVIFAGDNGHGKISGWDKLIQAGIQPSGPYRGAKGDIYEGGHRVPLVVRWPGQIAAGSTTEQPACLNDIFATCADLLNDKLPDDVAEDSFSFLPALLGKKPTQPRTHIVSHSVHGEFGYCEAGWKVAYRMPTRAMATSRGEPTVVALYDLNHDIGEEHDVAGEYPDKVRWLTEQLKTVIDRGRSRPGPVEPNDTKVRFDRIPALRWGPALH